MELNRNKASGSRSSSANAASTTTSFSTFANFQLQPKQTNPKKKTERAPASCRLAVELQALQPRAGAGCHVTGGTEQVHVSSSGCHARYAYERASAAGTSARQHGQSGWMASRGGRTRSGTCASRAAASPAAAAPGPRPGTPRTRPPSTASSPARRAAGRPSSAPARSGPAAAPGARPAAPAAGGGLAGPVDRRRSLVPPALPSAGSTCVVTTTTENRQIIIRQ
jgi:hypothetical protein